MKISARFWLILLLPFLSSCGDPKGNPADAFNAFLQATHKEKCKEAFTFFSSASQEKIRQESAKAIKDAPAYAEQFTPEKFYCTSVYANRYAEFNRGSAKPGKIEGSNATVIATIKVGTGFALPGFSPFFHTNAPAEVRMVKENGAWKIDLLTPTTEQTAVINAREKALARERETAAEAQQKRPEGTHRR